jgi:hypothetical protein
MFCLETIFAAWLLQGQQCLVLRHSARRLCNLCRMYALLIPGKRRPEAHGLREPPYEGQTQMLGSGPNSIDSSKRAAPRTSSDVSDWHPHWAEAAAKGVNMPSHILKSGQTYQELMGCHARWVHNPENASL